MASVIHNSTAMSDHYKGMALDIVTRELPKWMRKPPRVVLWGAREGDVQFGSPEDREWADAKRPRTPRFYWQHWSSDHIHIAA